MPPPRLLRLITACILVALAAGWILWHRRASTHDVTAHTAADTVAPVLRTLHRGAIDLYECNLPAAHTSVAPIAAYCATVDVAEDRAHANGRHIGLRIAILPAGAAKPAADAVTFLDGGPGGAALSDYPLVAQAFAPLNKVRDILLIDQRGTGESNGFKCTANASADERANLRACVEQVSQHADPRFYTTTDATADLDEVRSRLGYPQLTVIGVSYGTRVAQVYARDYPRAVRTLVLDSPVPNTLALGSEHATNLESVLELRLRSCVTDLVCAARFGDPAKTLADLLTRLDAHPIDVSVADPVTHLDRQEHLTRSGLAQLVRFYAYNPVTFALLPLTLDDAKAGRYHALLGQLLLVRGDLSTRLDGPLELSVLCSEDASLLRENPAVAHTVLGTGFVRQAKEACDIWPHAPMRAHFHDPLTGAVPTLLLSGEFDPVTPARYATEIARPLSRARALVIPGQGHSVMGVGCAPQVVERFVVHADVTQLQADCLARERAVPFFLGYAGAAP